MNSNIHISSQVIDVILETSIFQSRIGDAGAIATFTGIVRGEGDIETLTLSHFPGYTETEVEVIATRARQKWPLTACRIVHRVGPMSPGDVIVFVAAASMHRRAAFEAVDFIMDYLKSEAPFWKQETRGDVSQWIEPRQDDIVDRKRWEA